MAAGNVTALTRAQSSTVHLAARRENTVLHSYHFNVTDVFRGHWRRRKKNK